NINHHGGGSLTHSRPISPLDSEAGFANRQTMTPPMHRRAVLKMLACGLVAPALSFAAGSKAESAKWKTAIGLNGFQSGSRKYKKNYPIWEVLDFAANQ